VKTIRKAMKVTGTAYALSYSDDDVYVSVRMREDWEEDLENFRKIGRIVTYLMKHDVVAYLYADVEEVKPEIYYGGKVFREVEGSKDAIIYLLEYKRKKLKEKLSEIEKMLREYEGKGE
jgi:chaperonin cofactor prefoldin